MFGNWESFYAELAFESLVFSGGVSLPFNSSGDSWLLLRLPLRFEEDLVGVELLDTIDWVEMKDNPPSASRNGIGYDFTCRRRWDDLWDLIERNIIYY